MMKTNNNNKEIEGYIATYEDGKFPYVGININYDPNSENNNYEFPVNNNARYNDINWIGSFTDDPNCKSGFCVFEKLVDAHKYYYNKLASIVGTHFDMYKVISDSNVNVTNEVYDEAIM